MPENSLVHLFDHVRRRKLREDTTIVLGGGWLTVKDNKLIHHESPVDDSMAFDIDPNFMYPLREAITVSKVSGLPVEFHTPTYVREAAQEITNIRQTQTEPDAIISRYNVLADVDAFQKKHGIEELQAVYNLEPDQLDTFDAWAGLPPSPEGSHDRSIIRLSLGDAKMYGGYSSYTPREQGDGETYRQALTEAIFLAHLTDRPVEMAIDKFALTNAEVLKPHMNANGTLNVPPKPASVSDSYIRFEFDAYEAGLLPFKERMAAMQRYRDNLPKDP